MINKQQINSCHLHSFLILLNGEDDASIQTLIDPTNHQNVPQAMKLMATISQLPLLKGSFVRPVVFYEPFVMPTWLLEKQLTSLAKFAFLAFAHHRLHGTGFMMNQLYADLQEVAKTVFFNVAKQKEVDGSKLFYLYQQGSDRLEQMFGDVRMMLHLCERLSDCIDVNHRAHRQLSYTGTEGVDHVNTRYFTGNLVVNDVNLDSVWKSGQIVDGVDFLRPYGGGRCKPARLPIP
ncbi:hypothetical protein BDN71DRAFT_1482437 [Pleurotus eryngii]|uniref:Uncharacterized protein n=1 Tax=Pleurotus eryngii TaxID=5323 RepID=A0A9P5ZXU0_PLEER|nr:hypothetical protein BDN71DRAFT_1482437 [Pleurotus eryngii]